MNRKLAPLQALRVLGFCRPVLQKRRSTAARPFWPARVEVLKMGQVGTLFLGQLAAVGSDAGEKTSQTGSHHGCGRANGLHPGLSA